MDPLESWTRGEHTSADGATRPTYRKGSGPGVIVIHELPGMTPDVIAFADEVVSAGFTVVMPQLFGTPGAAPGMGSFTSSIVQVCTTLGVHQARHREDRAHCRLAAQPGP